MRAKESAEDYADRFFDQSSFPLFQGVEPYWELFNAGRIHPFINFIRVTLSGIIHLFFYANEDGGLVRYDDPDSPVYNPEDILNGQWQLESIVPKRLAKRRS